MMKKLTKDQRLVLTGAVEVFDARGENIKPIHCHHDAERAQIDQFSKSYATYNRQMWALMDAGLIARQPANTKPDQWVSIYAYVADIEAARAVLAAGVFEVKAI